MDIRDMMNMQLELHEKHRGQWEPLEPDYMRSSILYMFEELGEVVAIIKKKGERAIAEDEAVREAFVTEMGDALMYFVDTLLRCGVTPEEFAAAYARKHAKNMGRDYAAEYRALSL